MRRRQIVGVVLVRNEDLRVRQVVENAAAFCDRMLLADHGSTDGTQEILGQLAAAHPHLTYHRIASPRESHDLIAGFADTDTWIFAVDGDEIYDPAGLARIRQRIFADEFNDWWMIFGHVLNCDTLDPARKIAAGFLAPPCRSVTKLFNFRLIRSWTGDTPERLHGGYIVFHAGYSRSARLNLYAKTSWADASLRCLHTCFLPRSSRDPAAPLARKNITEIRARDGASPHRAPVESAWKNSRYRRGQRVSIDARAFFPKPAVWRSSGEESE